MQCPERSDRLELRKTKGVHRKVGKGMERDESGSAGYMRIQIYAWNYGVMPWIQQTTIAGRVEEKEREKGGNEAGNKG
jgi:hypothetical protein